MSACKCGCGQTPLGRDSRFMSGHHNRANALERVFSRLVISPDIDCLLWTGCRARGYGQVQITGCRACHREDQRNHRARKAVALNV